MAGKLTKHITPKSHSSHAYEPADLDSIVDGKLNALTDQIIMMKETPINQSILDVRKNAICNY